MDVFMEAGGTLSPLPKSPHYLYFLPVSCRFRFGFSSSCVHAAGRLHSRKEIRREYLDVVDIESID